MSRAVRVLGICGSPRAGGNSAFLLEQALAAAREAGEAWGRGEVGVGWRSGEAGAAGGSPAVETVTYELRAKKFGPCLGCGQCERLKGECAVRDSFQELRDRWLWADVVLYSVPVYHMSVPGQLKCFLDRLGNSLFWRYQDVLPPGAITLPKQLKVVGALAQGCHLFSGQEHTLTDLINHALIMQCVPVTGDLWEAYIGAGGWTENAVDAEALERQFGEGRLDAEVAVRAARSVGRRCVEMAGLLMSGAEARRTELARDPLYAPFLARVAEE